MPLYKGTAQIEVIHHRAISRSSLAQLVSQNMTETDKRNLSLFQMTPDTLTDAELLNLYKSVSGDKSAYQRPDRLFAIRDTDKN